MTSFGSRWMVRAALILALAASMLLTPPARATTTAQPPRAAHRTALRAGAVLVLRDTFGVPHIYARDTYGLFYGYGYAAAQDRLFQLEMTKRSAEGTVSEVLGGSYVGYDEATRLTYDPASIRRQLTQLSTRNRQILNGYTAGVNAWRAAVLARPERLMPKQFNEFGFRPSSWTSFDVAMIAVGTMNVRFSGSSAELSNLATLTALQDRYGRRRGQRLFDQLAWKVDPRSPSTITQADLRDHPQRGATRSAASPQPNGLVPVDPARLESSVAGAPIPPADGDDRSRLLSQRTPIGGVEEFSNMMLVGRRRARGATSLMLNGPQFGWVNPAYVYSVGLHGAGFDIVGNTPFAYPVILFGHNRNISWGATAGNGDTVDMYQERLNPANSRQYLFRGRYRDMAVRNETVRVKGGQTQAVDVLSTVHGIVVASDTAHGVAYSQRRTWSGREVQTMFTWIDSTRASSWTQWRAAAKRLPISINWYYSDRQGNIGYVFCGRFPRRPANQDRRLPASGTGNMEWQGFLPFAQANPHILNPVEGVLANWNNSPAPGYPNSDFIPWARVNRVEELQKRLAQHGTIDAAELWEIMREAALADLNVHNFRPFIARAVRGLPPGSPEQQVYRSLASWNGLSQRAPDGRYDSPGTAIMQTWLQVMLADTLGKVLPPEVASAYTNPGYPTREDRVSRGSKDISQGVRVLYNALLGKRASVPQTFDIFGGEAPSTVIRRALRETSRQLTARFGGGPSTWRPLVARNIFSTENYLGIPSASPSEGLFGPISVNRGTENDLMIAHRNRITGFEVVPPGESGFVAPDGSKSRHYADQFSLYNSFGYRPTWFTFTQVLTHAESFTVLPY